MPTDNDNHTIQHIEAVTIIFVDDDKYSVLKKLMSPGYTWQPMHWRSLESYTCSTSSFNACEMLRQFCPSTQTPE